jgi:hypothetical protein
MIVTNVDNTTVVTMNRVLAAQHPEDYNSVDKSWVISYMSFEAK